jgi:hypothetical protein
MDYVLEIAPLVAGGCVITMGAQEAGSSRTITVSDDYSMFKQLLLAVHKHMISINSIH